MAGHGMQVGWLENVAGSILSQTRLTRSDGLTRCLIVQFFVPIFLIMFFFSVRIIPDYVKLG